MLKQLQYLLLRIPQVQRAVANYKQRQKDQAWHERWKALAKSSGMIH